MSQDSKNKIILAFDANLILIGMFSTYYSASKATGIPHHMITKACNGTIVAAKGMYWREADDLDDVVYDCDDLGTLTLLRYDSEHHENRKIYASNRMKKNNIITEAEYVNRLEKIKEKKNGKN